MSKKKADVVAGLETFTVPRETLLDLRLSGELKARASAELRLAQINMQVANDEAAQTQIRVHAVITENGAYEAAGEISADGKIQRRKRPTI